MYDDEIDKYIQLVAVNRIKAYIKSRFVKIFPEYDEEVNKILYKVQYGILCN